MRRRGQIAVEYVALIAVLAIVAGFGVFNSMFGTASQNVVDSSPKYQEGGGTAHQEVVANTSNSNVKNTVSPVLGPYTEDFMKNYDVIASDPSATNCRDALVAAMTSLSNFKTGNASNQDLLNIIRAIGQAGASNITDVNANYLIGNACGSLTGNTANSANTIGSILDKDLITIDYKAPGCSKNCTVASEANSILDDLIPLFNSGQIPVSAITSAPNAPVTSVTDVKTTLTDYYYIKSSQTDAGYKYMNTFELLTYLHDNGYLPSSIETKYQDYLPKIKASISSVMDNSSNGVSHPNWETPPAKV